MIPALPSRVPTLPRPSPGGVAPSPPGAEGDAGEPSSHRDPEVTFELVGANDRRLRIDGASLVFGETLFSTRACTRVPHARTAAGPRGEPGALTVNLPELDIKSLEAFRAALVGEGLEPLAPADLLAVAVAAHRELVESVRDEAVRRLAADTRWIAECHPHAFGPAECAILDAVRGEIDRASSRALLDALIGVAEGDTERTRRTIARFRETWVPSLACALEDLAQVQVLGDRALTAYVRSALLDRVTRAESGEAFEVFAAAQAAGDEELLSAARTVISHATPRTLTIAFDALERSLDLGDGPLIEAMRRNVDSQRIGSISDQEAVFPRAMRRGETRIIEQIRLRLLEQPPETPAAALARLDAVSGDPRLVEATCLQLVHFAVERRGVDSKANAALHRVFEHPELPLANKLLYLTKLNIATGVATLRAGLIIGGGAGLFAGGVAACATGAAVAGTVGLPAAVVGTAGIAAAVPLGLASAGLAAFAVGLGDDTIQRQKRRRCSSSALSSSGAEAGPVGAADVAVLVCGTIGTAGLGTAAAVGLTSAAIGATGIAAAAAVGLTSAAAAGSLAGVVVGTTVGVPTVAIAMAATGCLVLVNGTEFGARPALRETRRAVGDARRRGVRLVADGTRAVSEASRAVGDATHHWTSHAQRGARLVHEAWGAIVGTRRGLGDATHDWTSLARRDGAPFSGRSRFAVQWPL